MKLFSFDNPFMVGLRKLTDHVFLGILWVLASVPVVTFGAATTAMFYTAEKTIVRDEGNMFPTFWKAFRKDFRQATVLWLLQLLILALMAVDARVLLSVALPRFLRIALLIAGVFVFVWLQLWFGYLSKFEDTGKVLLRNTLRMAVADVFKALLLAVLAVAVPVSIYILLLWIPPLVGLVPGLYQMLAGKVFRSLFRRYTAPEAAAGAL